MTKKQEGAMMDQIVALYEAWARHEINSESGARLINGLFNVAKKIDGPRMSDAFRRAAGI